MAVRRKSEAAAGRPAAVKRAAEAAAVRGAAELVERSSESQQPRFRQGADQIFAQIMNWVEREGDKVPPYASNSRRRDAWLSTAYMREPFLDGCLYQATTLIKNRGWSMTGGRNQVIRFTKMAHDAEDGEGWRVLIAKQAMAFYTTDLGSIVELGREGRGGPVRKLWHLDPTRCYLTGRPDRPLAYVPPGKATQMWRRPDFFRTTSQPVIQEAFNGLGYCAVSRAVDMMKLMIALMEHDREKLGAKAPKGIFFLKNVSEEQWKTAMSTHEANMEEQERQYYGGLAVIAQLGADMPDGKIVALSELPSGFDQREFVDMLMYVYALVLGFDPSEFWPVQYGALGRGTESQIQAQKATGKGGLDFILSFQEGFQGALPDTLEFAFEQRDVQGEIASAALAKAWADYVKILYEAGALNADGPLLSREQVLTLLVQEGLIPQEWTEAEEDMTATDTDKERRQKARDNWRVRLAAEYWSDEPVVRFAWPSGRVITLYESGADMLRRRSWPVAKRRAADGDAEAEDPVLFSQGGIVIRRSDVDRALAEMERRVGPEAFELLTAGTMTDEEVIAEGVGPASGAEA